MNQETANYIMQRMSKYLDNSQMIKLKDRFQSYSCANTYLTIISANNRMVSLYLSWYN